LGKEDVYIYTQKYKKLTNSNLFGYCRCEHFYALTSMGKEAKSLL
jgi:hypothetical protein